MDVPHDISDRLDQINSPYKLTLKCSPA